MEHSLEEVVKAYARPFRSVHTLSPLIDEIGNAKIVLMGEATHGTSDFYTLRAELSKRLIEEKGFSYIAIEGDWPSSARVNQYIKTANKEERDIREVLQAFKRWPTWMWANQEMAEFIYWLKKHNEQSQTKAGLYGIDIYSLWESMEDLIELLTEADPTSKDLELAKLVYSCFEKFNRNPELYASLNTCKNAVSALVKSLEANQDLYKDDQEKLLNLKANALLVKNAESYYRNLNKSHEISWNIRDGHMAEIINEIRSHGGEQSKIIVWEHNTHIGDARATDMRKEGMTNVGQLLREQHPSETVYAIGFGTYKGTVIAADSWGSPFEEITVPPAQENSWEEVLHRTGPFDKYILFNDLNRSQFDRWVGHRAIGVVYDPDHEARGNYVPSKISKRYDAFVFIDETRALKPLKIKNPII